MMFNKKNRCYNGGNQHNFIPRYDERERQSHIGYSNLVINEEQVRKLVTINVYVRDICTWCGKTIERTDKKGEV